MTILFDRVLDDVPLGAFTERERAAVATGYFLHLVLQLAELRVVEPAHVQPLLEEGYDGLEWKHLAEGERELYSLAQEIRREQDDGSGEMEPAGWLYSGTLLATGGAEGGRLIFRAPWGARALEDAYRSLRYGALLKEDQPLPGEHLLSFETWGDAPGLLRGNVSEFASGEGLHFPEVADAQQALQGAVAPLGEAAGLAPEVTGRVWSSVLAWELEALRQGAQSLTGAGRVLEASGHLPGLAVLLGKLPEPQALANLLKAGKITAPWLLEGKRPIRDVAREIAKAQAVPVKAVKQLMLMQLTLLLSLLGTVQGRTP